MIAAEVEARVLEEGLVPRQLALRLKQEGRIGPGIDHSQEVVLLHHLALLKANVGQFAGHPAGHRDRVHRRHRAEGIEIDVDAPKLRLAC